MHVIKLCKKIEWDIKGKNSRMLCTCEMAQLMTDRVGPVFSQSTPLLTFLFGIAHPPGCHFRFTSVCRLWGVTDLGAQETTHFFSDLLTTCICLSLISKGLSCQHLLSYVNGTFCFCSGREVLWLREVFFKLQFMDHSHQNYPGTYKTCKCVDLL